MSDWALIMAGGIGKRLKSLSSAQRPKQFLELYGGRTLLQHTYRRLERIFAQERILVATSVDHVPLVREQLPEAPADNLIGESQRKNTAPCIALAAWLLTQRDPEAVMGVFPADHFIADEPAFQAVLRQALRAAATQRALVTLGIQPTEPATQYGYIQRGAPLPDVAGDAFRVERFTEKPPRETAEAYLRSGDYFWNGGVFAWRADVLLEELAAHLPKMAELLRDVRATDGAAAPEALHRFFDAVERMSIDYGVLERSRRVMVFATRCGWSDLGSFDVLQRLAKEGLVTLNPALQ